MKRVVVIAAVSALLAGCSDPYAHGTSRVTPPPVRPTPAPSASSAARAFALRWINWDWRSAAAQQRALAELAGGALAADLRANAASARIDASLARDKPGSRGTVAIVDVAARASGVGGLVVTREERYTAGHAELGGPRYRVYAIELVRDRARWEVSAWKPQP